MQPINMPKWDGYTNLSEFSEMWGLSYPYECKNEGSSKQSEFWTFGALVIISFQRPNYQS